MKKIFKGIVLFFAWVLIVGALLGVVAFAVYIVLFFYNSVFNHSK